MADFNLTLKITVGPIRDFDIYMLIESVRDILQEVGTHLKIEGYCMMNDDLIP